MKKILLTIIFLMFVAISAVAEDQSVSALSLFYQGNLSYKDGDYQSAIQSYEKIIASGQESGSLYFNLGNSYFKLKNLGKAVLNYERALRLIPRDSDLESNYEYAVMQILNYPVGAYGRTPLQIFSKFKNAFTADELTVSAFLIYLALIAVIITGVIARWSGLRYRVVSAILCLLLLANAGLLFHKISANRHQAVIITGTEARFEPRQEATVYFKLPEGSKVSVQNSEGDWLKIIRQDGKAGWIKRDSLESI